MKPHHRVYFMQFALALTLGALLARLPDLQRKFELGESQIGLLLLTGSLGVLFGLTFCGRLVERAGARATALVTIVGASLCYAVIPWMPDALLAAPLFFASGILAGAMEINANVEADRYEAALGRRIMSRVHGMWSLGFFVTALIAATLRQAAVSIELHLFLALIVVGLSSALVFARMDNAPRRADDHAGETPRLAFPTIAMLPLCLLGAAPLLVEGAGVDWSAIYMRDVFAVEPFIGGLSVTLFSLAIAIGRLGMDPIVDRFSPQSVALVLLATATAGVIIVAAAPNPYLALAGFVLAGIGCSSIYPLAISAVARRSDRPAAVNVAALAQMTFVVFFAGPPLLGFMAEQFGIRSSYWSVLPVLLAALLTTRALVAERRVGRTERGGLGSSAR